GAGWGGAGGASVGGRGPVWAAAGSPGTAGASCPRRSRPTCWRRCPLRPPPLGGIIRAPMAALDDARKRTLRRQLEAIVGRGGVLSDPDELLVYESDGLTLFRALADFVVFPTSSEHVS